jgi:hypothetical protein
MVDRAKVENVDPLGGIDFDPNLINLQTEGQEINVKMPFSGDPAMMDSMQIEGLVPVIINVTPLPVSSLPAVFGLSKFDEADEEPALASNLSS